ncbi:MAG: hypothetical protein EBX40_06085, partial [Gammaproteobacteria bacterium]|nr:hypothetical protein [Gammaproteobacteria bacterium]
RNAMRQRMESNPLNLIRPRDPSSMTMLMRALSDDPTLYASVEVALIEHTRNQECVFVDVWGIHIDTLRVIFHSAPVSEETTALAKAIGSYLNLKTRFDQFNLGRLSFYEERALEIRRLNGLNESSEMSFEDQRTAQTLVEFWDEIDRSAKYPRDGLSLDLFSQSRSHLLGLEVALIHYLAREGSNWSRSYIQMRVDELLTHTRGMERLSLLHGLITVIPHANVQLLWRVFYYRIRPELVNRNFRSSSALFCDHFLPPDMSTQARMEGLIQLCLAARELGDFYLYKAILPVLRDHALKMNEGYQAWLSESHEPSSFQAARRFAQQLFYLEADARAFALFQHFDSIVEGMSQIWEESEFSLEDIKSHFDHFWDDLAENNLFEKDSSDLLRTALFDYLEFRKLLLLPEVSRPAVVADVSDESIPAGASGDVNDESFEPFSGDISDIDISGDLVGHASENHGALEEKGEGIESASVSAEIPEEESIVLPATAEEIIAPEDETLNLSEEARILSIRKCIIAELKNKVEAYAESQAALEVSRASVEADVEELQLTSRTYALTDEACMEAGEFTPATFFTRATHAIASVFAPAEVSGISRDPRESFMSEGEDWEVSHCSSQNLGDDAALGDSDDEERLVP